MNLLRGVYSGKRVSKVVDASVQCVARPVLEGLRRSALCPLDEVRKTSTNLSPLSYSIVLLEKPLVMGHTILSVHWPAIQ